MVILMFLKKKGFQSILGGREGKGVAIYSYTVQYCVPAKLEYKYAILPPLFTGTLFSLQLGPASI